MYMYVIMKTICPPGYEHKAFVASHALGHMMHIKYCGDNQEGTLFLREGTLFCYCLCEICTLCVMNRL